MANNIERGRSAASSCVVSEHEEHASGDAGEKRPKRKGRKVLFIVVSSSILIAGLVCAAIAYFSFVQPSQKYAEAMDAFDSGRYDEAEAAFSDLGDYKDSKEKITSCRFGKFVDYVSDEGTIKITEGYATASLAMTANGTMTLRVDEEIKTSPTVYVTKNTEASIRPGDTSVKVSGTAKGQASIYSYATITLETDWDIAKYTKDKSISWTTFKSVGHNESLITSLVPKSAAGDIGMMMKVVQKAIDDSRIDITVADLGFCAYETGKSKTAA